MNIDELRVNIGTITQSVESSKLRLNDNVVKLSNTKKELFQLEQAKNLLTVLKNQKMEDKREFILQIINTALTDVFDQGIRIDIEANSLEHAGKINMKYHIVLYQNDIEMARNEKLLGNNGGGVLSFVSILFKILVGYIYSDNKFFLFDESISQVSPLYRPRIAKFLKTFCNTYGFTLVIISQTDDIDEFADVGYLLDGTFEENIPLLKIDQIFGDKLVDDKVDDNYTYVQIENFQSIKKLEFRYKGFTVIRGNNNIGKSASFRAINALLFNTFDSKDHPRKNRSRGSEVKITFGYYSSNDSNEVNENRKIQLAYKGNKVHYTFDGKTYSGKNLAFEKVKDKAESIGFKYVNLKETYKNFKGNLKDQTERLAVTTQYDGFYLIGNKTSETEKVFNFLFDSTVVANAIMKINNDMLIKNDLLNGLNESILFDEQQIKLLNVKLTVFTIRYYILLINNFIKLKNVKFELDKKKEKLTELIKLSTSIIDIENGLNTISEQRNYLKSLDINKIQFSIDIIDTITSLDYYLNSINSFLQLMTIYQNDLLHVESINNSIAKIDNIVDTINTINTLNDHKIQIETYLNEQKTFEYLKQEYDEIVLKDSYINNILLLLQDIENIKKHITNLSSYLEQVNYLLELNNFKINSELKLSKLNELMDLFNQQDSLNNGLNYIQQLSSKILTDQNEKSELIKLFQQLDEEYNLCQCDKCQGMGLIPLN